MNAAEPAGGSAACPCGSGERYDGCCGPLHAGAPAPTAERLMRSRFSAFALGLRDFLLASWHPSTRPGSLELDPEIEWRRLLIQDATAGGAGDREGHVTFTAVARSPAGRFEQRERSRFLRDAAEPSDRGAPRWRYVDGEALG